MMEAGTKELICPVGGASKGHAALNCPSPSCAAPASGIAAPDRIAADNAVDPARNCRRLTCERAAPASPLFLLLRMSIPLGLPCDGREKFGNLFPLYEAFFVGSSDGDASPDPVLTATGPGHRVNSSGRTHVNRAW